MRIFKPSNMKSLLSSSFILDYDKDIKIPIDIDRIEDTVPSVFDIEKILKSIENDFEKSSLWESIEADLFYVSKKLSPERIGELTTDQIIKTCEYVFDLWNNDTITIYRSTDGWYLDEEDDPNCEATVDIDDIVDYAIDKAKNMGYYWTPSFKTAQNYCGDSKFLFEAELDTDQIDLDGTVIKMMLYDEDEIVFKTDRPTATLMYIYEDDIENRKYYGNNITLYRLNNEPINKEFELVTM